MFSQTNVKLPVSLLFAIASSTINEICERSKGWILIKIKFHNSIFIRGSVYTRDAKRTQQANAEINMMTRSRRARIDGHASRPQTLTKRPNQSLHRRQTARE